VTGEFIHSRGTDAQIQSLQGAISAKVLGEWFKQHGQGLLDGNVRVALSHDSGVNAEIVRTLLEDPWNFWFFHKGVTALCETWKRFIKLEGRESGFGARITFTNNRANPITARDMLAMHYVQQRMRDDFAVAFGWGYLIRADEDAPEEQDKCSVLEAVIAMASARPPALPSSRRPPTLRRSGRGPVTSTGSCSAPAPARPRSGAGSGHCASSGPSCRRTIICDLIHVNEHLWDAA
jgi:hypothetical protein